MPIATISLGTAIGGTVFSGVEDAGLMQLQPTQNNHMSALTEITHWAVGDEHRAYIKFTGLSNLTAPITVSNARIGLYFNSVNGTDSVLAHQLIVGTTVNEMTWNQRATGVPWASGAYTADSINMTPTVSAALSPASSNQFVELSGANLDRLIEAWVNGTQPNHGLLFLRTPGPTSGRVASISTSNNTDATRRPYLTFTHEPVASVPAWTIDSPAVDKTASEIVFTVTLDAPAPVGGFNGFVDTGDITAISGIHFIGQTNAPFNIPAGQTTGTITVLLQNIQEKLFGVVVSGLTGTQEASTTAATVTIVEADPLTPVIQAHRLTGVAPLAITFDALQTVAPTLTTIPFSEIHYDWEFGDPAGNATWNYGVNPGVNLKNLASGPVVAHVFETHGSYTVRCWAYHKAADGTIHSGSATLEVVVTNPDTVFAANTIYISQNSTPIPGQNGVPMGATVQQVPNWNTVQTLAQTYKRILLKRGDVWSGQTAGVELSAAHDGPGIIGAYGTGNKPEISSAVSISHMDITTGATDWRVMDIFFTGASVAERTWSRCIFTNGAVNALFLRTDARWATTLTQTQNSNGIYLVDCVIGLGSDQTGTRSYGNISGDISRAAFMGSRFFGADSFTVRWQGMDRSFLSNCTLDAPKAPESYARFALRGKTNPADNGVWVGQWTENNVISDNYMVGDATTQYPTMGGGPQAQWSAERTRNAIFERNFVSHVTGEPANFFMESVTVRNNLFVTLGGSGMGFNIQGTLTPEPTQGWIYNNTFYRANTSQGPGFSAINIPNRVTGYILRNNVAYAPGSSGPSMFSGAGVEGVNFIQSNNSSNAQILSVRPWAFANPLNTVDYTPVESYANGGGVRVAAVYSDFFNTHIDGTINIGAI